jgi:hypothetical protein
VVTNAHFTVEVTGALVDVPVKSAEGDLDARTKVGATGFAVQIGDRWSVRPGLSQLMDIPGSHPRSNSITKPRSNSPARIALIA